MKYILIILLLLNCLPTLAQVTQQRTFLQTNSKFHLYYVDMRNDEAMVYAMGSYIDKAGSGYSISYTDTLTKQPDGSYAGKNIKIVRENNIVYLITKSKKTKQLPLESVSAVNVVNHNLNNAYYLNHYVEMSNALNKTYPLQHHSFRNSFRSWQELQNTDIDYLQFRTYANQRLQQIKDSISQVQDHYVVLTNYLVQNIAMLDYSSLKDSLIKLPTADSYTNGYYVKVINEVAKQRPAYFFQLAKDFPNNRSLIFWTVQDNKEVMQGLKAVEGHDEMKTALLKDKRFNKTMPYKIIGVYAIVAGLVTLLIVSQ